MRSEQRLHQILTVVGGFLMPLGLAFIGIGWYGAAHTGYVFEQIPYLVSGGLFGLGLTFCGALVFFSSWLARMIDLQRQQADTIRRLLQGWPAAQAPAPPAATIAHTRQYPAVPVSSGEPPS